MKYGVDFRISKAQECGIEHPFGRKPLKGVFGCGSKFRIGQAHRKDDIGQLAELADGGLVQIFRLNRKLKCTLRMLLDQ